jgi:hypothetical protein
MLAIDDFRQPADPARDSFLTVTGFAGVHQRSGRFTRVQMRSGIIDRPCFCSECQVHSPSAERTYPCSGRGMRPPHLQASLRSLQRRAITRPDSGAPPRAPRAGRNEPDRLEAARLALGRHVQGTVRHPVAGHGTDRSPTDPDARRSSAVSGSPSERKRLGESVHAPERLSTSTGSVPCLRPEQGQDRKPAQRER